MQTHITRTVASYFAALRQIRSIRRSISGPVLQSLVAALVILRLDYGSATLATSGRAQRRGMTRLHRKFDHITPLLQQLHWLRMPVGDARVQVPAQHGTALSHRAGAAVGGHGLEARSPIHIIGGDDSTV